MKKIAVLLMFVFVVGSLSGCSGKEEASLEAESEVQTAEQAEEKADQYDLCGGFTVKNAAAGEITEAVQKAFDEAVVSVSDVKYVPLACVGQQVVSGMNYAIMASCTENGKDAPTKLVILYVYAGIAKEATLSGVADFNLLDHVKDEETVLTPELLLGGWNVPSEGKLTDMSDDLAAAVTEAFAAYDKVELEAMACLGTQVVAGTNYALVCRGKTRGEVDARYGLYVVKLYSGVDGTKQVISLNPVDVVSIKKTIE